MHAAVAAEDRRVRRDAELFPQVRAVDVARADDVGHDGRGGRGPVDGHVVAHARVDVAVGLRRDEDAVHERARDGAHEAVVQTRLLDVEVRRAVAR